MRYWLMKSEPSDVSVDDVAAMPKKTVNWYGVRNFQARNFMKDEMKPGDGVLFYHSSCAEPGVVGIAEVASEPYPTRPSSTGRVPTSIRSRGPTRRAGATSTCGS
jgi:predicted RNA-binding protein with PUA-like domain